MHKYLRAIGFSQLQTKKELNTILSDIIKNAENRQYTSLENDVIFAEFSKEFAKNIGLAVRGEFDEEEFLYDYYYPYFKGDEISSQEDVSVERQAEKESYAGVCDDIKVGVSLIFYLQNIIDYIKVKNLDLLPVKGTTLTLTGLSVQGIIMMPIVKNETEKQKIKKVSNNRNHLIEAARKGDEEAIENLTLEDMDTYTVISRKIQKEDVFSLVDTYFMPYGVECDQYSVLGEISDYVLVQNSLTGEEVYQLKIICNEITLQIAINRQDLYGEPMVGRRFKGVIWLQGYINFPNE